MPSSNKRDGEGFLPKGKGYKNLHDTTYCFKIGRRHVKFVDRITGKGKDYPLTRVDPSFERILERGDDCRPEITPFMLRETVAIDFAAFLLDKADEPERR